MIIQKLQIIFLYFLIKVEFFLIFQYVLNQINYFFNIFRFFINNNY